MQQAMGSQDIIVYAGWKSFAWFVCGNACGKQSWSDCGFAIQLSHYPMVESAQMDRMVQTLYQFNQLVNRVFGLAITLGVAFVLVAHNTIRLQILSHKEEVKSPNCWSCTVFVCAPTFLYQAAWLLSAGISLGLCTWIMKGSQSLVNQIFTPYGINLQWRTFHTWEMVRTVLVVTCALGMGGARG